jgi:hypothetical protein
MEKVINIACFLPLILLATLLMLWRRADEWDGVPLPKRFVLAISASRNWWLAYSFGFLFWYLAKQLGSFTDGFSVVVFAVILAVVLSILRIPR